MLKVEILLAVGASLQCTGWSHTNTGSCSAVSWFWCDLDMLAFCSLSSDAPISRAVQNVTVTKQWVLCRGEDQVRKLLGTESLLCKQWNLYSVILCLVLNNCRNGRCQKAAVLQFPGARCVAANISVTFSSCSTLSLDVSAGYWQVSALSAASGWVFPSEMPSGRCAVAGSVAFTDLLMLFDALPWLFRSYWACVR